MTAELTWLAWALVLALVHVFAFDVARTGQYGITWNTGPRDAAMPPLSPVAERLRRAQDNLYETLPLFAAAVLIAHVAGERSPLVLLGCQLYVLGRVAYLPLYAAGVPWLRSLVWLASFTGLVLVLLALLT